MKGVAWAVALVICVSHASSFAAPPKPAAPVGPKPKTLTETLTGQAKIDYESARLLVGDGDFAGARIKFQAAYETSKDPRLLFNVAASEKQLRHYAKAVELLKRYAASPSSVVTAQDKDEAAEFIKTLEPFTVAVTVDVTEPDAAVEIDDVAVGQSPLPGPVVVDIGQRRFRARKVGYREFTATVTLGGSTTQTVLAKLEKEVHEGKLSLQVPPGASVLLDGQPFVVGPTNAALTTLPSGGHTLRVTLPGMRPYDREVIVKDNELRAVDVQLDPEAELERPKLRVHVGCVDPMPRSAEDGLALYVDGGRTTAAGGKKVWNADLGRDVTDYVAFPVATGPHKIQVRIPGCAVGEAIVDVRGDGADLHGALPSELPVLLRGPAGSPDWGRIGVALWLPNHIGPGLTGLAFSHEAEAPLRGLKYSPSGVGISVQPGLTARWVTMSLDLGFAAGTATLESNPAVTSAPILAAVSEASDTWLRAGLRAGARIPFNVATFHLGVGMGYDRIGFTNLAKGITWNPPDYVYGSAWTMLDIHLLCDFPLFAGFHVDLHDEGGGVSYGLQLGGAFQPNKVCRAERSTTYELTARAGGAAQ